MRCFIIEPSHTHLNSLDLNLNLETSLVLKRFYSKLIKIGQLWNSDNLHLKCLTTGDDSKSLLFSLIPSPTRTKLSILLLTEMSTPLGCHVLRGFNPIKMLIVVLFRYVFVAHFVLNFTAIEKNKTKNKEKQRRQNKFHSCQSYPSFNHSIQNKTTEPYAVFSICSCK